MRKYWCFILVFFAITACDPDRKKKVDPENSKFETLDSSELFFKNMRQYYYDVEEKREAGLEIFRLQDRLDDNKQPLINLSIIFNWRVDKAYVFVEPNQFFKDSTEFTVVWQDSITQDQGEFYFVKGNREAHFKFSAQVYNSILDEQKLYYKRENELFPLLDTEIERDVFRVTMFDFFRLVNYFSSK